MFFEYDISFCDRAECPRTNCRRHRNNTPIGVPVSVMMLETEDYYECEYFYRMTNIVKDKKED